jgi:hypothetical protein
MIRIWQHSMKTTFYLSFYDLLPTCPGSQQLGVREREANAPRPQHGLGQQSVLDCLPGNTADSVHEAFHLLFLLGQSPVQNIIIA